MGSRAESDPRRPFDSFDGIEELLDALPGMVGHWDQDLISQLVNRIEEEMAHSRARLADAERVARLGSWEWDIPSNRLTCSDGLFAIYGIEPEDFDGAYEPSNTKYVHPDDRELVESEMEQAVETGT